jgi:hypothetical protein
MAVSSLLELLLISESQTQKATAISTALTQMESVIAASYDLDTSAATTIGYNLNIPFDDANDLSSRTALRFIYLTLLDGATENFNVIHPDNNHLFIVNNQTTETATIKTSAGTGSPLAPGQVKLVYCDGTDIVDVSQALSISTVIAPYDVDVAVFGAPNPSETLARIVFARETTFPDNFAGSRGACITDPSSSYAMTVRRNGSSVGTVTVATDGSFAFNTTGSGDLVYAAGDVLTVTGPADPFGIEDINFTLVGTVIQSQ